MAIRKTIQDGNISVQDFSTIKVHTSICNDCIVKDFGIIKLFLIIKHMDPEEGKGHFSE